MPELRTAPPDRTNAVPAIVVGTIGWLIALVVLLVIGNDSWWRWVCLTGFVFGVFGVPIMARYQRVHGS